MDILFEDETLLVISKPPGIVVNKAESVFSETVQEWVEKKHNLVMPITPSDSEKTFYARGGIAHRLDKETSGALLIAKTPEVLTGLMKQFQLRQVEKEYVALCHGNLEPMNGWFYLPLKRKGIRVRKFGAHPFGKESYTEYTVVNRYKRENHLFTLVRLYPKTGRTHQIRVHLSHYGFPIASDSLYASAKQLQADLLWCPRHFLHAERIRFIHPSTSEPISIYSPLFTDLRSALSMLNQVESKP